VVNAGGSGRLLVVEHGRHAPAGLLADWAATRSLRIQTVALHAGKPLPAEPDFAAAVVLGSELTAYDDTLPWLAAELAFIEGALAASVSAPRRSPASSAPGCTGSPNRRSAGRR